MYTLASYYTGRKDMYTLASYYTGRKDMYTLASYIILDVRTCIPWLAIYWT